MTLNTNRTRLRSRILAAALLLTFALVPTSLWALECKAVDSHGLPRDCTALEELGGCMSNAMDSYAQCRRSRHFYFWWRCTEDAFIDLAACALTSPFRVILR